METEKIQKLQKMIEESENIVFFGGAGVSTESGIPDFRSQDGLYRQKYPYPPETILSRTFYDKNPDWFFRFYREKMICLEAKPNAAHEKLAELERAGKLKAVITQNIDGLHTAAGSHCVLELHGSVHRNYCRKCGALYDAEWILRQTDVPVCSCGGRVKPDVVLYEEQLDNTAVENAIAAIANADTMIIVGTSLVVYPAASYIHYFNGDNLVVLNKSETSCDNMTQLAIYDDIVNIVEQL